MDVALRPDARFSSCQRRAVNLSEQKRDIESMQDLLIAAVFIFMIIAPCLVASAVGRVDG
jgi:hypothetical protein